MRRRFILAAFLAVTGCVWLLQGTGYIRGYAMTGQPIWAIAGALMLIFATLLFWTSGRRGGGDRH